MKPREFSPQKSIKEEDIDEEFGSFLQRKASEHGASQKQRQATVTSNSNKGGIKAEGNFNFEDEEEIEDEEEYDEEEEEVPKAVAKKPEFKVEDDAEEYDDEEVEEDDVRIKLVNSNIQETFLSMSDQQRQMLFQILTEYIIANMISI